MGRDLPGSGVDLAEASSALVRHESQVCVHSLASTDSRTPIE